MSSNLQHISIYGISPSWSTWSYYVIHTYDRDLQVYSPSIRSRIIIKYRVDDIKINIFFGSTIHYHIRYITVILNMKLLHYTHVYLQVHSPSTIISKIIMKCRVDDRTIIIVLGSIIHYNKLHIMVIFSMKLFKYTHVYLQVHSPSTTTSSIIMKCRVDDIKIIIVFQSTIQ